MSESLLSELIVRISAQGDPSLEQEMGKLVDTIDGVTGKFSEFSRSARESISLISGEAIGLTSKIEGITNAIGVTNKNTPGGGNARKSISGTSKTGNNNVNTALKPNYGVAPQIYVGPITVNVGGNGKSIASSVVTAGINRNGLSINLPEKLLGFKSEVASLGR